MNGRWTHCVAAALVLGFVFAGCSGVETGGVDRLTAEVSLEGSSGCRIQAGGAVLLDEVAAQHDPNLIVIEAQDAQSFQWQPGIGVLRAGRQLDEAGVVQIYASEDRQYSPQESAETGGGQYIDHTHQAVYVFRCAEPGPYTLWARHYLPRGGTWVYRLQFDDEPVIDVRMSASERERVVPRVGYSEVPIGQWVWVNAGTFDIAEGTRRLNLTNLHAGKRLDRLVLSRDPNFVPEGIGPEATPRQPLQAGHVISEPVRLIGGATPVSVSFAGGAGLSVSQDRELGPTSWHAAPLESLGGERRSVALDGLNLDPGKPLWFRIDLERGGPAAEVRDIQLTLDVPRHSSIVLENDAVRLRFDRATGFPAGIVNKVTGQVIQPEGLLSDPFDVYLEQGPDGPPPYPADPRPEGITLSAADATVESVRHSGRTLTARYSLRGGEVRLTTRVALSRGDIYNEQPMSTWTVEVENRSPLDILSIRYPRLQRIKIGESSTDDVLAWGRIGGEMVPVPAQAGAWSLTYPGRASVAFLDVFDDEGGFYFAITDPDLYASDLEMNPRPDSDRIDLSMQKRHRIRQGQSKTWSFQAAPHAGDWHWGADRYREFFHATFGKPDYPQWLLGGDGWIAASHMYRRLHEDTYEDVLIRAFERAMYFGYDYVQNWATTFRGACPTYYLPLNEYGGAESFAAANAWWRERGGHAGYYFHGNSISPAYIVSDTYWSTPWSEYPEDVRPPSFEWYVRNRSYTAPDMDIDRSRYEELARQALSEMETNGRGNIELYERMTMAGPEFAKHQTFWAVDKYAKEYNATVIYWDTFAWGGDVSEFNPHYGCYGDGNVTPPRRAFMADTLAKGRRVNPDFYQLTEGCLDIYGTEAFHMISGFTRNPEVFRYTLPEQLVFEGHQNGGWGSPHANRGRIESAFLYGNKFDAYDHLLLSNHLQDIVRLRKWLTPWMNASAFMDRLGVRTSSPDVRAIAHRVDHGGARGVIVTFHNPKEMEGTACTLDLWRYGVPQRALVFELGADPAPLEWEHRYTGKRPADRPETVSAPLDTGNMAVFAIPAGKVSAVLFVEKAEGPLAWHVGTYQNYAEGVALQAINYSGEPMTINIEGEGVDRPIVLVAGSGRTEIVTPSDPAAMTEARKLDLAARRGTERRALFQGLLPAMDNINFERHGVAVDGLDGKAFVLKRAEGERNTSERFATRLTPGVRWRVRGRLFQETGGAYVSVESGDSPRRFWGSRWPDMVTHRTQRLDVPNRLGEWVEFEGEFETLGHGAIEFGTGGRNAEVMVTGLVIERVR